MKGGQNLRELQEKAKLEVSLTPCLVCGKRITDGFYGRWHVEEHVNSGTCSKRCNTILEAREKYPEHPAEAFERTHKL
jgi:predicted nucleic acid-binding Zn ribbon protein